jgi:dipeptidyl aminopeptidase/acylaminoacyl peptidase
VEYDSISEKYGKELDCKPTAVGLAYPVISSIHGHMGTYENLLYGYSEEARAELLKTLNLDEAVTENTVPSFIWTTAEDACVPPDNSLRFALALDKKGVPYELHVYPKGQHGLSTAKPEINLNLPKEIQRASKWLDDCVAFFNER